MPSSHDRRLLERLSRATVWLDRGVTRRIEQGFAKFEAWRDAMLEREETERHKLGRKIGHPVQLPFRRSPLNDNVFSLYISKLPKALPKCACACLDSGKRGSS